MGVYSVSLVGESNYQPAVRRLIVGEVISLVHEPENPHDPAAVSARDSTDAVLGYVPRDHWLQRVVGEGGRTFASVMAVTGAGKAHRGVVLEVRTAADAQAAEDEQLDALSKRKGCAWW